MAQMVKRIDDDREVIVTVWVQLNGQYSEVISSHALCAAVASLGAPRAPVSPMTCVECQALASGVASTPRAHTPGHGAASETVSGPAKPKPRRRWRYLSVGDIRPAMYWSKKRGMGNYWYNCSGMTLCGERITKDDFADSVYRVPVRGRAK